MSSIDLLEDLLSEIKALKTRIQYLEKQNYMSSHSSYGMAVSLPTFWVFPKEAARLVGVKAPGHISKRFRDFCESHPKHFNALFSADEAVLQLDNSVVQFSLPCFLHYYKYRDVLDAGARSIKFEDDLPRIKKQLKFFALEGSVEFEAD